MGVLSFLLRPSRPAPFGEIKKLGCVRQRLTFETTTKNGVQDLLVQAFYPAEDARNPEAKEEPYFREQIYTEIGTKKDIPLWGLRALLDFPQIDAPLRPAKPESSKKWPVAVFSSGLWGSCEMYTQFCRDLASLGVIVLALEHEDGSGIWATSGTGEPIPYKDPPSGSTIPEFRAPQLDQRASDLAAAAFAIQNIAQSEATSSTSLLAEVLHTGDANDLLFVGHSFGAAGMLTYLRDLAEKGLECPYGSALIMDLWTEPLPDAVLSHKPQIPIAHIVSTEFWEDKPEIRTGMDKVHEAAAEQCHAAVHITGTLHQWISETQLLMHSFLLRKAGMMGPGGYHACREATMKAASAMLASFRHPASQAGLRETLANLDPQTCELVA